MGVTVASNVPVKVCHLHFFSSLNGDFVPTRLRITFFKELELDDC